jgi:hypothetical protein
MISRRKQTYRLSADLLREASDFAARRRVPLGTVVENALTLYLSPDGEDKLEAAIGRRLDRLNRQMERMERHMTIANETLALFIRFWLTHTPPLPDTAQTAAQLKGRERYEGFIEALGRRLARGRTLADELGREVPAPPSPH